MERNDARRHPWKFANRLLSCRLSSAISLEDDQFGREVREVERGAVRDGRSEISTLWNSMGWFMTAISHQRRHALPRAPFGQHELARTDVQVSLRSRISRSIRVYHLRWTRGKPIARERESSLSLSLSLSFQFFLSNAVSFSPFISNTGYTFLFRCFYGIDSR